MMHYERKFVEFHRPGIGVQPFPGLHRLGRVDGEATGEDVFIIQIGRRTTASCVRLFVNIRNPGICWASSPLSGRGLSGIGFSTVAWPVQTE